MEAPELFGFRVASWDTALRVNGHRSAGRFHREGSPATQYISLHPLAPWAEYIRYHDLRTPAEVAERRLRMFALRLSSSDITVIEFENAGDYGLTPQELVGDDWGPCQELADRLRGDESSPKTLRVPSAALPGTRCVVILEERVDIPFLWTPVDEGDIPSCVVAERARPPESLLDATRRYGEPHAELEAWSGGHLFDFDDLRG